MILGPYRFIAEISQMMDVHFPHIVTCKRVLIFEGFRFAPRSRASEAEIWCMERFGPCARVPVPTGKAGIGIDTDAEWCFTRSFFGFKQANAALEFKLVFG